MCCEVVPYSDHSRAYVAAASGKKRTKPVVYGMCGYKARGRMEVGAGRLKVG